MPRSRTNPKSVSGDLLHLAVYRLCDRVKVACFTPRAEDQASIGETVAKVVEANAHAMQPRLTVTSEHGAIHYETSRYALFVAVTTADYPQRTAFKAVGELRQQFEGSLGDELHKAEEGGLSKRAQELMSGLCGRYADAANVDKTLGVLRQVRAAAGCTPRALCSAPRAETHHTRVAHTRDAHRQPAPPCRARDARCSPSVSR